MLKGEGGESLKPPVRLLHLHSGQPGKELNMNFQPVCPDTVAARKEGSG
jgi:hypothetical protein